MRIDFVNTFVSEGATILAAIFNNLLGILSRPLAFFSSIFFNRSRTMSILGGFRENELSQGDKNDSASTSPTGISRASIFAMLVKCTLKASAISSALFIVLLLAWISKDDLQLLRELSSLIRSQVLRAERMKHRNIGEFKDGAYQFKGLISLVYDYAGNVDL